jgi:hypothetical protein
MEPDSRDDPVLITTRGQSNSGFAYVFHVSRHELPDYVLDFTIKPTGEMKILHIPKGMGWEWIMNYFGGKIQD